MIFSENRFTPRIKCGAGFFRIMSVFEGKVRRAGFGFVSGLA
jgi:hypothetical protein